MAKLKDFDQPIVFVFSVTLAVVGMIAILSWAAASAHMTGLLGLLKGGMQG
jgi:hypothetical protein